MLALQPQPWLCLLEQFSSGYKVANSLVEANSAAEILSSW